MTFSKHLHCSFKLKKTKYTFTLYVFIKIINCTLCSSSGICVGEKVSCVLSKGKQEGRRFPANPPSRGWGFFTSKTIYLILYFSL